MDIRIYNYICFFLIVLFLPSFITGSFLPHLIIFLFIINKFFEFKEFKYLLVKKL